jgi:hypothetical protein
MGQKVRELFGAFGELMASAWECMWGFLKEVKDSMVSGAKVVGNAAMCGIEKIKEWGNSLWQGIKGLFMSFGTYSQL